MRRTPLSLLTRVAVAGLASATALPAMAAEPTTALNELVVVGNRAPSQISEVPGTVWVLEGEELQRQFDSGQSLKNTLGKLIPGMDLGTQNRTNFGQNLRGRSVLVMIDGVSLNSSRGVSRQFDSIDPFNIKRIEVLSGATAIYGGGSTGGIINIITKKGETGDTQFETELGATTGFNKTDDRVFRAGQSISGGNEDVKGRLAMAVQDNGGFYDGNGDQILTDITQTDLQYNRSVDLMGSVQFNLTDTQSLDLTAQYYNSRYQGDKGLFVGQNLSQLNDPEVRNGFQSDRDPESDRYLLNASYRNTDFLGHTAYLQASTRREEVSFHPYPGRTADNPDTPIPEVPYVGASMQNTEQHTLKGMLVKEIGDVRLTYGVDLDREDFDANQMIFDLNQALASGLLVNDGVFTTPRYPEYRVDGVAGFFQAEWQATDRLKLDAGVRHRRASLEVGSFVPVQQRVNIANGVGTAAEPIPGGKNDYNVSLLNAGAIYDLTDNQQVWGNFSQGMEIPDPGKALGQGNYALTGMNGQYVLTDFLNLNDNNLPALKTNQVELGWRQYTTDWDVQVASYYTWSDEDTQITDELTIRVVDSRTRAYGLEAGADWRITDQWQIGGSGHYVRSEVRQNGEWQKQPVTGASLPKATAHVQWGNDLTTVRFQGAHAFDIDDEQGREIEGPTTFDLQATQRLAAGELTMGINNVFDKQYTTVWSQRAKLFYGLPEVTDFKGRGRTYTLSYAVKY